MKRNNLSVPYFWYISNAGWARLSEVFTENPHRSWWPLGDSPSLNTLRGRAKGYSYHYLRSRERLFEQAGLRCIRVLYDRHTGRRAHVLALDGEKLSDIIVTHHTSRGVSVVRHK